MYVIVYISTHVLCYRLYLYCCPYVTLAESQKVVILSDFYCIKFILKQSQIFVFIFYISTLSTRRITELSPDSHT